MRYLIAISGNMGVGKTTLSKKMAEHFGFEVHYEPAVENPYLPLFYEDMKKWAFHSQMFFLGKSLESHFHLTQKDGPVIQDRSIYEHAEIFARNLFERGLISPNDWQIYYQIYKTGLKILRPPDLVVYLKASDDLILQRIRKRNREFEKKIDENYVIGLNRLYDEWASGFDQKKIMVVDYDNLDLKHNVGHWQEFLETIKTFIH